MCQIELVNEEVAWLAYLDTVNKRTPLEAQVAILLLLLIGCVIKLGSLWDNV